MSFEPLQVYPTDHTDKAQMYSDLLRNIQSMSSDSDHPLSTISNAVSMIHTALGALWTGFYVVHHDRLVLYPFQGPVACTQIHYNKGVCGQAWAQRQTIIVPDVELFPGHIACSSASRSEIVVPIVDSSGSVLAVLDIDSASTDTFDHIDQEGLEAIAHELTPSFMRLHAH